MLKTLFEFTGASQNAVQTRIGGSYTELIVQIKNLLLATFSPNSFSYYVFLCIQGRCKDSLPKPGHLSNQPHPLFQPPLTNKRQLPTNNACLSTHPLPPPTHPSPKTKIVLPKDFETKKRCPNSLKKNGTKRRQEGRLACGSASGGACAPLFRASQSGWGGRRAFS